MGGNRAHSFSADKTPTTWADIILITIQSWPYRKPFCTLFDELKSFI